MSFILKALKKLENEKASRKVERVEMNSAILTPDRRSSTISRYATILFVISSLVFVVAGTVLFFRPNSPTQVAGKKSPASHPLRSLKSSPPARIEDKPASPATTIIHEENPVMDRPVIKPAESVSERHALRRQMVRKRMAEIPSLPKYSGTRPSEVDIPMSVAPSSLVVNGIALQDDPSKSIAVVNGQIVKKGMSIAGTNVERIFLDKVRFRGDSGIFEVYLSK